MYSTSARSTRIFEKLVRLMCLYFILGSNTNPLSVIVLKYNFLICSQDICFPFLLKRRLNTELYVYTYSQILIQRPLDFEAQQFRVVFNKWGEEIEFSTFSDTRV